MTIDKDDLLNSIMESLDRIQHIKSEDIPGIDLYMDQVTTFMESRLKNTLRNPESDKVLTKTMINNYAKNDLLPPPVKKKYSKEHVLMLIFIYYFKGILSGLLFYGCKCIVNDLLGNSLLTVQHYVVDELCYELRFVKRIRQYVSL